MNEPYKQTVAIELDKIDDGRLIEMMPLEIIKKSKVLSVNSHKVPSFFFYSEVSKTTLETKFDDNDKPMNNIQKDTIQVKANAWYQVSKEEFEKLVVESDFNDYVILHPNYNNIMDTKVTHRKVNYTIIKELNDAKYKFLDNPNKETYMNVQKSYREIIYLIDAYIEALEKRNGVNMLMYNSKIEDFYNYRESVIDETNHFYEDNADLSISDNDNDIDGVN